MTDDTEGAATIGSFWSRKRPNAGHHSCPAHLVRGTSHFGRETVQSVRIGALLISGFGVRVPGGAPASTSVIPGLTERATD
jgi:hypothetical protein